VPSDAHAELRGVSVALGSDATQQGWSTPSLALLDWGLMMSQPTGWVCRDPAPRGSLLTEYARALLLLRQVE